MCAVYLLYRYNIFVLMHITVAGEGKRGTCVDYQQHCHHKVINLLYILNDGCLIR